MAFDGDMDDDAEGYLRQREAYSAVSGSYRVASTDTGLITLVSAVAKHSHFIQRIHTDVTTASASELWSLRDGAGMPIVRDVSAASVAHGDVDFGAQGVPCTEGSAFKLNISGATGAVGTIEWEGYKKYTTGSPLSYAAIVLADNPSYYWRLNDPSGTTATEVIGGVNGTISGGVTLNQPGALSDGDKAMTFNGTTGKIVTAANGSLLTPYTVEAWFRTTTTPDEPIFSTANPPHADGKQIIVGTTVGKLLVQIPFIGGTVAGVRSINDGLWHHVVVVFDGTATPLVYLDTTRESGMGALPQAYTGSTNHPIEIGFNAATPAFWNGSLDDVAIYPLALTPAQIRSHYEARTYPYRPGSYPAKVVQDGASYYWRLEEPSGTTAVEVIQGVNGTISGGVTLNQPGALSDGSKGMTFNGTTGQILTAQIVPLTPPFSLEAWVYLSTHPSNYAPWVTTTGAPGADIYQFWVSPTGKVQFGNAASFVAGLREVADGRWHHIVCVFLAASTTWSLYVDGVSDTVPVLAAVLTPNTTRMLAIGVDNIPRFWTGSLDDVALYPSALTAAQVSAHYLLGIGQPR